MQQAKDKENDKVFSDCILLNVKLNDPFGDESGLILCP